MSLGNFMLFAVFVVPEVFVDFLLLGGNAPNDLLLG